MLIRVLIVLTFICSTTVFGQMSEVQNQKNISRFKGQKTENQRAIRRYIPLTNSIRKAHKAGTRNKTGRPGANYWQLKTDFLISARLDPATQTITGSETITLHNTSPDELKKIVLRLDHNLFRPRNPLGFSVPAENTEGMVVTKLTVNGDEIDLKAKPPQGFNLQSKLEKSFVFGLDKTVAHVYLAKPVAPKSVNKIEIEWRTKLPGGEGGQGHRMTQRWGSKLFQPTQWFPRLAKYDDLRGWEENVYLGPSEFYNNFGKFDVSIEMPEGWLVSGTGVLQNPEKVLAPFVQERLKKITQSDSEITIIGENERGYGKALTGKGRTVWHFVADQVNDFAWATSKEFIWKATRASIPQKGYVPIHMFYLPERANKFEKAGERTRHALEFYSKLWIPYEFPQLTLQDGPSAGMEYPMVINSNQGAADHETYHQWIPMMIGTNETRYGWMDEGFNQYSNVLSNADAKGKPYSVDGLGQQYGSISGNEDEPPLMWNANYGGPYYGFQTYGKTPLMLSMLGGVVGDEKMNAAIKKYMETWKFKHPSPWDFTYFMNEELGQNLDWFWYYWLFTTEAVNGSIKSVEVKNGKTEVTIHQAGEMPSPIVLKVEMEPGGSGKTMTNAKMLDANTALVTLSEEVWFDGDRDEKVLLDFGGRKISKITFDPYKRFPDSNPKDNVWTSK